MKIKQLSLFLENQPGALSKPVKALAKAKFNILTLSLADTQQFGILRLILEDWERAKKVLEKQGYAVKVTDMIAIEVPNEPGGLASVLDVTVKAGVSVEYMYGFTLGKKGKGLLAMRFDDPDRAVEALQNKGLEPLKRAELFSMAGS